MSEVEFTVTRISSNGRAIIPPNIPVEKLDDNVNRRVGVCKIRNANDAVGRSDYISVERETRENKRNVDELS